MNNSFYNLAIYVEGVYSHRVYGFDTFQDALSGKAALESDTVAVRICGYWE